MDDKYFDCNTPLGVAQRYHHDDCSSGKGSAMVVTRTPTGWMYKCHRCGVNGFKKIDGTNTQALVKAATDLLSGNTASMFKENGRVVLPPDCTSDLPPRAQVFLLQYGIGPDVCRTYCIQWSQSLQRIVFPIFRDGEVVFFTCRGLYGEKPKWLSPTVNRLGIHYWGFDPSLPHGGTVVLVEDAISTLCVQKVVDCVGLLYCTVREDLVKMLLHVYGFSEVVIWLDADKSMYSLNRMISLRRAGYNVKRVFTPHDPKCYNSQEIKELVL